MSPRSDFAVDLEAPVSPGSDLKVDHEAPVSPGSDFKVDVGAPVSLGSTLRFRRNCQLSFDAFEFLATEARVSLPMNFRVRSEAPVSLRDNR